MAGERDHGGVADGAISRARFLKLAGLGAGLSLFPGPLFSQDAAGAQVVGRPDILTDFRYPIATWWPPPPVPRDDPDAAVKTDALYAQLTGAGFNTVLGGNGVANNRANRLALDACAANGLRLVLMDQALRNAIDGTATAPAAQSEAQEEPQGVLQALTEQDSSQDLQAQAAADPETVRQRIEVIYEEFGAHPALAGLLLYDEPHRSLFGILRYAKELVEQQQAGRDLPYVNVWPSHASPRNALGAQSYASYLENYMNEASYQDAVSPPMLSFDHYPLLANEQTTADFFYNHAVIRSFSLRFGVPSWGFVQSMGFDGRNVGLGVRRIPDEAEIFWQINVALAYGVKGIQYFTYWTPEDNEVKFGEALITRAGTPTARYDYAARANASLRRVGRVLLPLFSTSVTHFGERRLPPGARPFQRNALVSEASGDPAILGFFGNPGAPAAPHLLVVNRSPNRASRTRLTLSKTVRRVERFAPYVGEAGAFVPVPIDRKRRFLFSSLGPGRALLYRLRRA